MFFILTVIMLLVVSFFLSLLSLQGELKKLAKVDEAKETLAKGKIIFQASSSETSVS